jgi:hypothetical protein
MNERIKELIEQAQMDGDNIHFYSPAFAEKFAELIVKECIEVVEKQKAKMSYGPTFVIEDIKQHFGVEE